MSAVDWSRYPALLNAHHLAEIFGRKVGGVRKGLQERSTKLPTPCQVRPFKVRKDDCKRFLSRVERALIPASDDVQRRLERVFKRPAVELLSPPEAA